MDDSNRARLVSQSAIDLDFRLLFESAPGLYLVLTPELFIAGASDAYLAATMTRREQIVGRSLREVFPDNLESSEHAAGSRVLWGSLDKVVRTRKADVMAVQRYDVRRPAAEGGAFETRYWSPLNLPILGPAGELRWILHCVEDVTGFVRLVNGEGATGGALPDANLSMVRLARGLDRHVAERTAELAAAKQRLEEELAERERLEQQFRQAQKMEAIGQLAGGVAHDFNNLLTVIQGYSEMLQQQERDPGRSRKLAEIIRAAERATSLTRQLLAFSRQQLLQMKVLDLNAVVNETAGMLRRLIGEDVELITHLAADLGAVRADASQLVQLLMNLAVNARDAMPGGGRLLIETANVEVDAAYQGRHGAAVVAGPHVMFAVTDSGTGMDAATQERIFEPFFTTKEAGKGTGLGLATVYGVVKQCNGHIWVYSELGHGTCFKIYLPRLAEARIAPAVAPVPVEVLEGHEAVLLVEDEEAVRELVRETLAAHGYQVAAVSGPLAVLDLLEAGAPTFRLLLTDLVMPGMSGRELAQRLLAVQPGLRVVYTSGYTNDVVARQGIIEAGRPFLQKPFRAVDLLRLVRSALDAPAGGA